MFLLLFIAIIIRLLLLFFKFLSLLCNYNYIAIINLVKNKILFNCTLLCGVYIYMLKEIIAHVDSINRNTIIQIKS